MNHAGSFARASTAAPNAIRARRNGLVAAGQRSSVIQMTVPGMEAAGQTLAGLQAVTERLVGKPDIAPVETAGGIEGKQAERNPRGPTVDDYVLLGLVRTKPVVTRCFGQEVPYLLGGEIPASPGGFKPAALTAMGARMTGVVAHVRADWLGSHRSLGPTALPARHQPDRDPWPDAGCGRVRDHQLVACDLGGERPG